MAHGYMAQGSYVGTGSALEISGEKVGFRPSMVVVWRKTTRQDVAEWHSDMDNATVFKTAGDTGIRSLLSSQGLTPVATGFSVGTDVCLNNSGDTYHFVAYR